MKMSERKFFVLSICALKRRGVEFDLAHANGLLVCGSEVEARQTGIKGALERWSLADGWMGHDVIATRVEYATLQTILESLG